KPPRHDPPSAGPAGPRHKVLGPDALLAAREAARAAGRRVVQCHGCFDIVHPGHIRHLRFAKSQGDILLVSITGDDEVRKGTGRPLIPQELRAENLAELDCVDWVHIEPNPTATGLIERVRPDIYIKGREYETIDDPRFEAERRAVERHGGRVVFSSGDVVFSSTALIDAMQESIDPYHRRLSHLVGQPELAPARLDELVGAMRGKRVVIVGEVITDTYVFCDRPDVAGESPMLTLRPLEERAFEGGAAILARHAAALGARPVLVTRLPDDEGGERVAAALTGEGVELRALQSPTPVAEKRRFLVGATKMLKLDNVPQPAWDTRQRDELVELATSTAAASPTDAAIIADFGLGLLSAPMIESLTAGLRPHVGVLAGDVSGRRSGLLAMRGMDVIAPSESELRDAMGNYTDGLPAVVWRALEKTGGARAIVTMAAEG
ncbi:MAG: adenylyltransferase/cytidyltransferase family protein, partial [Planctomycetota bacterium]